MYTHCAMGLSGSETALEGLMCRVLGDYLHSGIVDKLADDLYCGGEAIDDWVNKSYFQGSRKKWTPFIPI